MGATYAVSPLTDEARQWLRDENIAFPDGQSRWPTHNELRAALESFSGHAVSYRSTATGGWDADIVDPERDRTSGWMATVWVDGAVDADTPCRFSFHKPTLELSLMIVEKLSRVCGPFLIMDGSSGRAVVVAPEADIPKLVAELWA